MAPTIPYFRSPRDQCADAITISSSDQPVTNTLVILSSGTFSTSSVVIVQDSCSSRGGDEARGGQRSVPRRQRPPSAVPLRSATPRRCPSPCSVLSVRAPSGGVPVPPFSGGDDEATSRPKRKARYRKWDVDDELKVLNTLAELRWDNLGVAPQASVLLKKICADGGLRRRGVDATDLADKVHKLKKKFVKAAAKFAASGGRRLRNYRNRVLYKASMEAWPDLLPGHVVAAV